MIDCVGVTGKLDLCTAPTLMGLDLGEVPDYRLKKVEGMLTDMPEIVERARDCVESWILNVEAVNLFAKEQGVFTRRINWVKKSNGDLVYQFACGDRIGIKAIDELGKTTVMRYFYDDEKQDFVYSISNQMDLQSAIDYSHALFERLYADEKKLWDIGEYSAWKYQPATEAQMKFIQAKLSKEEWERLSARSFISKGDAGQILSAIQIRNLKKEDLLRMHRKSVEEKNKKEEELKLYATLKIRKLFDDKKPRYKVYAIKHPTDLVITNSWEIATDVITTLNQSGTPCKYKSFLSFKEATEYLRKA